MAHGRVIGMLYIQHSKCDQQGEGRWVAIGTTHGALCPLELLRQLLREGNYETRPQPWHGLRPAVAHSTGQRPRGQAQHQARAASLRWLGDFSPSSPFSQFIP